MQLLRYLTWESKMFCVCNRTPTAKLGSLAVITKFVGENDINLFFVDCRTTLPKLLIVNISGKLFHQ